MTDLTAVLIALMLAGSAAAIGATIGILVAVNQREERYNKAVEDRLKAIREG